MGIDLHYGFYSKKCNDKEVLPYLDASNYDADYGTTRWFNGKHMPEGFYDTCREFAIDDEENNCYIFDDVNRLFEFASRPEVPVRMSDYITNCYDDKVPIFIIWIR